MSPRRLRGDGGAATTETVLIAPALIFTILVVVQAGLYFHAVSVASAAAQDGARAASIESAPNVPSLADGEAEARALVDKLAPDLLDGVDVQASSVAGGERVRVTVSGEVESVTDFPGFDLDLSVRESSESVLETFRPGE